MKHTETIPLFVATFVASSLTTFVERCDLTADARRLLLSLFLEGSTAVAGTDVAAGSLRYHGMVRPVRASLTGIRGPIPVGHYEITINERFGTAFARFLEANATDADRKTSEDFAALAEWALHGKPGTAAPGIAEAMEVVR